jgi:hypothetical protein
VPDRVERRHARGHRAVAALAARFAQRDQDLLAAFAGRWLVFSAGAAVYAYDVVDGQVRTLLSETQYPRAYALGASLYLVDETGLWVSRLDAPQPLRLYKGAHPYVAGWRGDTFYFVPDDYVLRATDGRSVHSYKGDYLENFSVLAEQLGTLGSRAILSLPGYYTEGVFAIDDEKRELQVVRRVCIYKNQCSGLPLSDVTVAGGQAFFTVNQRLFHSDGTPHGTRGDAGVDRPPGRAAGEQPRRGIRHPRRPALLLGLRRRARLRAVVHVWAGPLSSYPDILGSDEHSLWFAATEPSVGRELWRLDLPAGGAAAAAGTRPSSSSLRAAPPAARARALHARRAQEPPWERRLR